MKNKSLQIILRSPKTVFSFQDLALLWQNSNLNVIKSRIHRYVRQGDLYRIRKGFYAKDQSYDHLEFATRIFTPAYISFETVLVQAGLIFQYHQEVTVASYLTRMITSDNQIYSYRKIKTTILTDPLGINHDNELLDIATPERAFLDTLYAHKDYYFDNLRPLNWDQVFTILPIYDNKRMIKKVNQLFKQSQTKSSMIVTVKEDMFAHKLMAMYERIGKTSRDIYDVWFFLEHHFPINEEIVKTRSQMPFKKLLEACINKLEKLNNRHILDGVGELLTPNQKDWAKAKLKTETIFLLKLKLAESNQP